MKLPRSPLAALVNALGESVEIYYEPRNEGIEWYVGLLPEPHRSGEMPLHGHFASLTEGLIKLKEMMDMPPTT